MLLSDRATLLLLVQELAQTCETRLSLCPDPSPYLPAVPLLSLGHTWQMRIPAQRSSFGGQGHGGCLTSDPGLSVCFIHSLHSFIHSFFPHACAIL